MDYESIKGMSKQLGMIWRGLKPLQQLSLIGAVVILLGIFSFIILQQNYPSYVQLFPNEKLQLSDSEEITSYLDNLRIPYKIDANSSVLVPSQDVQRARAELTSFGIPKGPVNRGYDLFDNSTWIRGEKELQILEIRALKGQLEQDISQYNNIRSSHVILDIAPSRAFGTSPYRTKASIILNLVPGTVPSQTEIQAITYHVAGAVRGLMPNMVAISDTSGKLYQGWDPEGNYDNRKNAKIYLEDQLKSKIDGLLSLIAGSGRYYSSVQVIFGQESSFSKQGKADNAPIEGIYVTVVLDNYLLEGVSSENHEQELRTTIEKQLSTMLDPYHAQIEISTSFASFRKGPNNFSNNSSYGSEKIGSWFDSWYSTLASIAIGFLAAMLIPGFILWILANRKWGKKAAANEKDELRDDINLEQMLESLKEHVRENPKIMADEIRSILKETQQDKR